MEMLLILAIILAIVGLIGAVMPAVPGAPVSYASFVCAYFLYPGKISTTVLIVMLFVTLFVMLLDYIAPIFITKIGGGSKSAVRGATLGMIIAVVGMLFSIPILPVSGPTLLILGPLVGAFIGEMQASNDTSKAIKVALLNFVSFVLTTLAKVVLSVALIYMSFAHLFEGY